MLEYILTMTSILSFGKVSHNPVNPYPPYGGFTLLEILLNVYLLLDQTEDTAKILEANGFSFTVYIDWSQPMGQLFLYTRVYSLFKVGRYSNKTMSKSEKDLVRIQIEPSQIPQIATLFNLGIYGEDLIPLLT